MTLLSALKAYAASRQYALCNGEELHVSWFDLDDRPYFFSLAPDEELGEVIWTIHLVEDGRVMDAHAWGKEPVAAVALAAYIDQLIAQLGGPGVKGASEA